jgi:hypothetical protein
MDSRLIASIQQWKCQQPLKPTQYTIKEKREFHTKMVSTSIDEYVGLDFVNPQAYHLVFAKSKL